MIIKNRRFKSEDALLESIFDFELGTATSLIVTLKAEVEQELEQNETFQDYRKTLEGEDLMELDADERAIRLAEKLMQLFDLFVVDDNKMYGVKNNEQTLLYSVVLV
jgi:hypothetical protein